MPCYIGSSYREEAFRQGRLEVIDELIRGPSHFVRIRDGKATDQWADIDQLGILRQLGLAPTPPAPAGAR